MKSLRALDNIVHVIVTLLLLAVSAAAQNGCGSSINWQDPLCQDIDSGSLRSDWTVASHHGMRMNGGVAFQML